MDIDDVEEYLVLCFLERSISPFSYFLSIGFVLFCYFELFAIVC